jgi:hypothetical protein
MDQQRPERDTKLADEALVAARHQMKELRVKYRLAAGRLMHTTLPETAHVQPMADGAFVEVTIWVPIEEAQKETL